MSRDPYAAARQRMVEAIRAMSQELQEWPIPEAVLEVMGRVPRHRFVLEGELISAYDNHPLPIGYGQTISQPYIVALMTALLELERHKRVLEIGAGSGYQTAILAELAGEVYSLEIVAPLAEQAARRLRELGLGNVEVKTGDGREGWPEHAPYDAIIVTAAPPELPEGLTAQLKPGGHLVIPVGGSFEVQQLLRITRTAEGLRQQVIAPVRFVPLTGSG